MTLIMIFHLKVGSLKEIKLKLRVRFKNPGVLGFIKSDDKKLDKTINDENKKEVKTNLNKKRLNSIQAILMTISS